MTTKPPRLTLDELRLAAATSGRSLLLVEGGRDRDFFEWLFDDMLDRVNIYTADDVEISPEEVRSRNLTMGARSQLICLSAIAPQEDDFRLVIDRDCGHDIPEPPPSTLCLTDYPAIESYAFTLKALHKWLKFIACEAKITSEVLLAELRPPLLQLYFLRLGRPNLPEPNYGKCYKASGSGGWALDLAKIASDYRLSRDEVAQIEALARGVAGDARPHVYGHDIAALLEIRLKAVVRNKAQLRSTEAVERTLRMSMERSDLLPEPLFAALQGWISRSSVSI
ncbi:hypothetical protein Nm8I071_37710 [Nonomuraea sp. TT08I-71]|nr:hypothetical protein Nm8I071_37710 [Nonomuraea sp. TT08I-71]